MIADEFARREMPLPTLIVGDWFLATLFARGTPQQVERFAGPTLRGEYVWCQLFSEPGTGSDLAGLSTRATRVEGGWRLTGQKVWNSRACESDWGVCLARSDSNGPKHHGLTFFLVDMTSAGLTRRPIRQCNDRNELAEDFLEEVFVPDHCVVGNPGEGWSVAVGTMSSERLVMGARLLYGQATTVARLLTGTGDGVDVSRPVDRDEVRKIVGECAARELTLSALNLRALLGTTAGQEMAEAISVAKVLSATVQRDGARALISLLGNGSAVTDGGFVEDYLSMPAMMFGGGTIEVQLNVIAQRLLGLPRS